MDQLAAEDHRAGDVQLGQVGARVGIVDHGVGGAPGVRPPRPR
ncbi:MAG: hypothetical protein ABSB76_22145 [Streptosporangiaceae bacterium]